MDKFYALELLNSFSYEFIFWIDEKYVHDSNRISNVQLFTNKSLKSLFNCLKKGEDQAN